MKTFNEVLSDAGIEPREVILVRHSGQGATGRTAYQLWNEERESFELYQSTQKAGRRIFRQSTYWAVFVAEPGNTTLFVGLYQAKLDDPAKIDWVDPLSGTFPGAHEGTVADLYQLQPISAFSHLSEKLRVRWNGSERSWVQYAHKANKQLDGEILMLSPGSDEGLRVWKLQQRLERSSKLGREAKRLNACGNGGTCICEACGFRNSDQAMFDAHHKVPLLAGERTSSVKDFLVLCPTCHRRAHRCSNRLFPYDLAELIQWVAGGRK